VVSLGVVGEGLRCLGREKEEGRKERLFGVRSLVSEGGWG
jgi:hypothetical protein